MLDTSRRGALPLAITVLRPFRSLTHSRATSNKRQKRIHNLLSNVLFA